MHFARIAQNHCELSKRHQQIGLQSVALEYLNDLITQLASVRFALSRKKNQTGCNYSHE